VNIPDLAAQYRASNQGDESTEGYVLIYLGHAFGWKRALTEPGTVGPGVLAIDVSGQVFEAQGGNDYDGALRWTVAQVANPTHLGELPLGRAHGH